MQPPPMLFAVVTDGPANIVLKEIGTDDAVSPKSTPSSSDFFLILYILLNVIFSDIARYSTFYVSLCMN